MRMLPSLAVLLALGCGAQAQTPAPSDAKPTETAPPGHGVVGEPLQAGANSFTEGQVRERFAKMGFNEVTDLKKDERGIWRGTAMHAGKAVTIGLDYKGAVAAE